jgi:hypothetical protein
VKKAQKRRLETDPDHTPLSDDQESSEPIEIPPTSATSGSVIARGVMPSRGPRTAHLQGFWRKKRVRERDSTILANSIRDSFALLAARQIRHVVSLPGESAVSSAVEDIQNLFAKDISEEELADCIEHLTNHPMSAVTWNVLSLPLKKVFIKRWTGGNSAGSANEGGNSA